MRWKHGAAREHPPLEGGRTSSRRVRSLDGLRGIAAAIVVVHHLLLTQTPLARSALDPHARQAGSAAWWLTYTPLHLVWAGQEAVFIFFVLSGFVLALPATRATRGSGLDLRSYYPRRLVRLYLPVWGAVAFAGITLLLVTRHRVAGATWWINDLNRGAPGLGGFLRDVLLVDKPGATNVVLWSLKWEVAFSLLLPAYILFGRVLRRAWPVKLALIFALIIVGARRDIGALTYLPMFALGTMMAFELGGLERIGAAIERRRHSGFSWGLLTAASAVLLSSYWLVFAVASSWSGVARLVAASRALAVLGACLALFVALQWPAARGVLERPMSQWVGVRSFSLYLVHEPVIVSVALALGAGTLDLALLSVVAVPLVLVATAGFYHVVERPSHALSQFVGRRCRSGARSSPTGSVAAPAQQP